MVAETEWCDGCRQGVRAAAYLLPLPALIPIAASSVPPPPLEEKWSHRHPHTGGAPQRGELSLTCPVLFFSALPPPQHPGQPRAPFQNKVSTPSVSALCDILVPTTPCEGKAAIIPCFS